MTRIAPESVDHPLAVDLEQIELIHKVIDGGQDQVITGAAQGDPER